MDLLYGAILLYGVIRGLFRGFGMELAGLVCSVLVFFSAWRLYRPLAAWLLENTRLESQPAGETIAYLLTAFLIFILWKVLEVLLRKLFTLATPDALKRPGGAILGGLKSAVFLCAVLLGVMLSGREPLIQGFVDKSFFGRLTQRHVPEKLNQWFPGLLPESEHFSREDAHGSGDA